MAKQKKKSYIIWILLIGAALFFYAQKNDLLPFATVPIGQVSPGNIIFLYHFDNNTIDESGRSLHAEKFNATITSGKFNEGYLFNGIFGYIRLNDTSLINSGGMDKYSYFMWIKPSIDYTNINETPTTFFYKSGAYSLGWVGGVTDGVSCSLTNSTSSVFDIWKTMNIQKDTWYHVGCIMNGTALKIYINGIKENEASVNGALGDAVSDLFMGQRSATPGDLTFNGTIDEVVFWNRDLSDSEVSTLYSLTIPASVTVYQNITQYQNVTVANQTFYVNQTVERIVYVNQSAPPTTTSSKSLNTLLTGLSTTQLILIAIVAYFVISKRKKKQ